MAVFATDCTVVAAIFSYISLFKQQDANDKESTYRKRKKERKKPMKQFNVGFRAWQKFTVSFVSYVNILFSTQHMLKHKHTHQINECLE